MGSVTITHGSVRRRSVRSAGVLIKLVKLASLPLLWLKRMRQRRELMGLLAQPDYMLKDVGLQRYDITHEAMKPFWRP
ncbi:MAG TPA: hypothetical protein VG966_11800 [Hyphomicrobiaceae bacterium]|nr:hypothetical protein [Hyphomicrobiaceae bacterium]